MSTANENAEAILIVIKRILKWIFITILTIVVILGIISSYYYFKNEIDSKKKKEEEDKISITAEYQKDICEKDYPYFYGIVNNGNKTVSSVNFSVEIKKKGYSSALNSYTSFTEDKILKPGEGIGKCFRAENKTYNGNVTEKDVDIFVKFKNVTFEE